MVVLNRIYTRTGDDGSTALGSGERRPKYDSRVAAYGTVDEVNAVIGVARLHAAGDPELDPMLARIQNDLFDVGADLCLPDKGKGPGGARLDGTEAQVDGASARLIDLSVIGALVISPGALKPQQRVRIALADDNGVVRFSAAVAWASFEIPKGVTRYRAGMEFRDAEAQAVEAFARRHQT